MVVIGCQTLDRLTGSYYAANVHRVINSISRRSIVFKLRGTSFLSRDAFTSDLDFGSAE